MITTIDRAGRVVIPQVLRRQFHLSADIPIELIPDGDSIRLRGPRRESCFVEKDGVLVQSAESTSPIDATAFINQLREARSFEVAGAPSRP
jgi:bifunctional DNA-binding transcriptional regulator/antitoxin component of YhaV-PrlF toxin-antitoxin module